MQRDVFQTAGEMCVSCWNRASRGDIYSHLLGGSLGYNQPAHSCQGTKTQVGLVEVENQAALMSVVRGTQYPHSCQGHILRGCLCEQQMLSLSQPPCDFRPFRPALLPRPPMPSFLRCFRDRLYARALQWVQERQATPVGHFWSP